MNTNSEDPRLELVTYKFCLNLAITGQYTKKQIFLDQDWANHAVTKFCGYEAVVECFLVPFNGFSNLNIPWHCNYLLLRYVTVNIEGCLPIKIIFH